MSELSFAPIQTVLGDPVNGRVKVEESWSKDLPPEIGVNAPVVKEIKRDEDFLKNAVLKTQQSGRRTPKVNDTFDGKPQNGKPGPIECTPTQPLMYHFFVIREKSLEFIGTKDMPVEKFSKDISGRFFREWLKKSFPGRNDYDDICVWDDNTNLKEITELLAEVE